MFLIGAIKSHGGQNSNGDHYQYVVFDSSFVAGSSEAGVKIASVAYHINWNRRVQEIEVIRKSTHTVYINWISSVPSAQLSYSSWAYVLDLPTSTFPIYTETVPSDIMSIFISSCGAMISNIRIRGKGW